jgi:hypothetical protein
MNRLTVAIMRSRRLRHCHLTLTLSTRASSKKKRIAQNLRCLSASGTSTKAGAEEKQRQRFDKKIL